MQERTAILLIGAILTVGLSLVVGVGVVDVSAADTLVVDQDGTAEYSSIQTAIDNASAGDTVEIRPGTYAETIVVDKNITVTAPDGATLNGTDVDSPYAGITIGGFDSENVEPTIRGLTITRYIDGIESNIDGDWVVSDVTIRIVQQDGISAGLSSGDWTVRDSEVIATGFNGIVAGENGEWLIEDTIIRRTEVDGVDAESTSADWTIRNVSVQDSGDSSMSIDASDSDGDWLIEQTSVQDESDNPTVGETVIDTQDSNGKWEIRQSVITGDVPISASDTLGEWRVSQSIINETSTSSFDEGTAIDATDAIAEGIATDNWWGSPSGPDENACVGNVDCSDPLTTRPSDVGYNPDDGDESTLTPTPTPTPTPSKDIQIEYDAPAVAIQSSDTTPSPQANGMALDVAVSEGSVGFGGTETAVIRIRQPRTGASLTITPNTTQEYNVTDFDTQNLYDADGSLKSPKLSISTENNQFTEIDVTVSGDEDMFNRSIFAQYVVELQTAQGTVLDETDPGLRAVGYPGQLSQSATEGIIEVTFPRVASVDDSWDVEYRIRNENRETLISKPVTNVQTRNNFSVNVSSGRLSEGTYRQVLVLKQNESDPVNKQILRIFTFGDDGIRITDGQTGGVEEPQSPVDEFDTDGNGDIEITELGQAGQAFASGELTITELGEVGAAFAS